MSPPGASLEAAAFRRRSLWALARSRELAAGAVDNG